MVKIRGKRLGIVAAALLVILIDNVAGNIRKKRLLTFPRTSPTRLQVSSRTYGKIPL